MENMTECGFVYLFRDHTRYEIMSNFDVKHSQVVSLFFLVLCMENVTDRGVVFAGPEERPKPLPVFSKVQTRVTFRAAQEDLNHMQPWKPVIIHTLILSFSKDPEDGV